MVLISSVVFGVFDMKKRRNLQSELTHLTVHQKGLQKKNKKPFAVDRLINPRNLSCKFRYLEPTCDPFGRLTARVSNHTSCFPWQQDTNPLNGSSVPKSN